MRLLVKRQRIADAAEVGRLPGAGHRQRARHVVGATARLQVAVARGEPLRRAAVYRRALRFT